MNHQPTQSEIAQVQQELGFDYLQALRHLQSREAAKERAEEMRRQQYREALEAWRGMNEVAV